MRLTAVDGQPLLAFRLKGPWNAVIEVDGPAGPDWPPSCAAPNLSVVALQSAADGAARGLRAGRLLILGPASACLGYGMLGGSILALDAVGPRAGLRQQGGLLAIAGPIGPLAAERQCGGTFWASGDQSAIMPLEAAVAAASWLTTSTSPTSPTTPICETPPSASNPGCRTLKTGRVRWNDCGAVPRLSIQRQRFTTRSPTSRGKWGLSPGPESCSHCLGKASWAGCMSPFSGAREREPL